MIYSYQILEVCVLLHFSNPPMIIYYIGSSIIFLSGDGEDFL